MYESITICRFTFIFSRTMHKIIQYDNYIIYHLNAVIRNETRQYKRPDNSGLCLIHFQSVYDVLFYLIHDGWIYSMGIVILVFLLRFY